MPLSYFVHWLHSNCIFVHKMMIFLFPGISHGFMMSFDATATVLGEKKKQGGGGAILHPLFVCQDQGKVNY